MDNLVKDTINSLFVRIAPSKIHGVGLIAIRNINVGQFPIGRLQYKRKNHFVPISEFMSEGIDDAMRDCIQAYFSKRGNCFLMDCETVNEINLLWYLNHSKTPNVEFYRHDIIAIRKIKSGEELTIDYFKNCKERSFE